MSFEISRKKQDESSRIIILDVKVSDNDIIVTNLYNVRKKSEQIHTPSTLCNLLDDCKNIVLRRDFNYFSI